MATIIILIMLDFKASSTLQSSFLKISPKVARNRIRITASVTWVKYNADIRREKSIKYSFFSISLLFIIKIDVIKRVKDIVAGTYHKPNMP